MTRKAYLGDGAYYEYSNLGVHITAENGLSVQNDIYLGPNEIAELLRQLAKDFDPQALIDVLQAAAEQEHRDDGGEG